MSIIKNSLHKCYLDEPIKGIFRNIGALIHLTLYQTKELMFGTKTAIINQYIANENITRLHIGCGKRRLSGWLNSDYFPNDRSIIHLDATRKYPFTDKSLNYIYSEHMIEHVSYQQGRCMLQECYRTLKEGGKLRISTPDLKFLLDLYTPYKSEIQQSYIKWATDNHINGAPSYTDTIVINNYFRDWGHLFIYDFTVLKETLESIGFKEIKRQFINKSNDPELADLENESRMPPGFLELESLIVEAVK